MTQPENRLKMAIVGAGREGLELMALLAHRKEIQVFALVDPDDRAPGFHLKDYGYRWVEALRLRQSRRLKDLMEWRDVDLVVDASPGRRYRAELLEMGLPASEIMDGATAKFLWGMIFGEEEIFRRRFLVAERLSGVLNGLDPALAGDEPYALLLRALQWTTHAAGIQQILFDGERVVGDLMTARGRLRIDHPGGDKLVGDPIRWSGILRDFLRREGAAEDPGGVILDHLGGVPWGSVGKNRRSGLFLCAYDPAHRERMDEDLRYVSALLRDVSGTLEKFAEEERRRRGERVDTLQEEIAKVLASPAPLAESLKVSVERLARRVSARGCHLYIQDPQTEDFSLVGTTYAFPETVGPIRLRKHQGLLGEVLRRGEPLFFKETFPLFDGTGGEFLPSWDAGGILYLPLKVSDYAVKGLEKAVGVLVLEFASLRGMDAPLFQVLLKIGTLIAGMVSSDVERYRMSQKVTRLSVVTEEGVELLSSKDRKKVFILVASSAAMIVDAEAAVFRFQGEGGTLPVGAVYGVREEAWDRTLLEIDHRLAARAVEMGEPLFISDIREELDGEAAETFPYRAGLVIPIRDDQTCSGTLSVYNKLLFSNFSSSVFTEDDREVLDRFNLYVTRALTGLRQHEEQEARITLDDLTGFRNERYLQTRLPEEVRRAKRYHRELSLVFFEILEEENGRVRTPSDEHLRRMAAAVQETFRFIDVLVRLRDSRFVALLPDTGEGVKIAVTRLGSRLAEEQAALRTHLKLLVGTSTFPGDGEEVADLVKKASKLVPYRVEAHHD